MNYYAGIGSRETPEHILKIMHHIGAYLWTQGWTLRSGYAEGADKAFDAGVQTSIDAAVKPEFVGRETYLPWANFNHATREPHFISPDLLPFSDEEKEFTAKFHPAWKRCSPSARLLHQRNTRIMLGHPDLHGIDVVPVSFVICWTQGGEPKGGTAQALRIATALDIPVINLGRAENPSELEDLVLRVDEYQTKLKSKGN